MKLFFGQVNPTVLTMAALRVVSSLIELTAAVVMLLTNDVRKAVAVNSVLKEKVTIEEASEAFKKGFEKGLNIHLEPYELTEEETEFVEDLARTKYATACLRKILSEATISALHIRI